MADIFDYLKWRGDVPFSADPFNEADGLVLAMLAYTDFDGILNDSFRTLSVRSADRRYFETHSRIEAYRSDSHQLRSPLLMEGMLSGERFGDVKFTKYLDAISADKGMQISAFTCLLNDGSAYVSFRGTDNTVIGWKEDFNMSYLPDTEGQQAAVRYLDGVAARVKGPLRVGGHSKGGNFAVYAAAFCSKEVQDRILKVYTYDGPGFRDEVMSREPFGRILPKVVSIVPDTSVVGMLLTSSAKHMVVKSSEKGLAQHDALTWQLERNRFVVTELTPTGELIRDAQKDWLSKIDDESREAFVNTLFTLFESTGMDTFNEMKENRLKTAERVFYTLKDLPRERQKELLVILEELLYSGTNAAKGKLTDFI